MHFYWLRRVYVHVSADHLERSNEKAIQPASRGDTGKQKRMQGYGA